MYAASHEEGKEYLILQDLIAAGFHTPAKTKTLRLNQPFLLHFISDGGMILLYFDYTVWFVFSVSIIPYNTLILLL